MTSPVLLVLATETTDKNAYAELRRHLNVHRSDIDQVFATLVFDAVTFVRSASAPDLFAVAPQDQICPPSHVYGADNLYGASKEIAKAPTEAEELGWLGPGSADGLPPQPLVRTRWSRTSMVPVLPTRATTKLGLGMPHRAKRMVRPPLASTPLP